jgi:hypothetical protein
MRADDHSTRIRTGSSDLAGTLVSPNRYEQMLDMVSEGMLDKVRPQRGHKVPLDKLGTLRAVARESLPYSDLVKWSATVFGKHFSKAELEEIEAFFGSPTGKKYTEVELEMKAELGEMTSKLIEERLRAALSRRGLETVD